MSSIRSLAAATSLLSLIASSTASAVPLNGNSIQSFNINSKSNVALYWGQGNNQEHLASFCYESSVDIINIGFVNTFIAQSNGWPGENFGNACWGPPDYPYYDAPGYDGKDNATNDRLPTRCPWVAEGIPICQSLGKKVILSLGGAWVTPEKGGIYPAYSLTGATDGESFADFLWGAYGPYQQSWVDAGNPRPLDGGDTGLTGNQIDIDGFDFDIELPSSDSGAGYIACINRLRVLMAQNPCKKYLITGAPQCILPDANMQEIIQGTAFDIIWPQFYNNPSCNVASTGFPNFADWTLPKNLGLSSNAKIYTGILGSESAGVSGYANISVMQSAIAKSKLLTSYPSFGGVMVWEATAALNNIVDTKNNQTFYQAIKSILPVVVPSTTMTSFCPASSTTSHSSTSTSHTSTSSSSSTHSTTSPSSTHSTTSPSSTSHTTTSSSSSTHSTTSPSSTHSTTTLSSSSSHSSTSSSSSTHSITSSSSPSSSPSSTSHSTTSQSSTSSIESSTSSTVSSTSESSASTSVSSTSTTESSTSSSASVTSSSSTESSSSTSESSTSSYPTTTSESSTSSASGTITSQSSSSTFTPITTWSSSTKCSSSASGTVTSQSSSSTFTPVTTWSSSTKCSSSASGTVTSQSSSSTFTPITTWSSSTKCSSSASGTVTSQSSSSTFTPITSWSSSTKCSSSASLSSPTAPYGHGNSSASSTGPIGTGVGYPSSLSSSTPPSPTSSPGGDVTSPSSYPAGSTSESTTQYTTSTVYTTKVITTTSCAPTVTNCPNGPHKVTVTVPLYTTICPVTETETPPAATSSPSGPETVRYTTSTVVTTSIYTISKCAATVTDCPYTTKPIITTDIITLYTTVCPVAGETGTPVSVSLPPFTGVPSSIPTGGNSYSFAPTPGTDSAVPHPVYPTSVGGEELTTTSTRTAATLTSYVTVQKASSTVVMQSTVIVIPTPKYPTPVKVQSSAYGTGTGIVPSGATYTPVYSKPTTSPAGAVTYPAASSPVTYVTGAGARMGGSTGLLAAVIIGAVAMIL